MCVNKHHEPFQVRILDICSIISIGQLVVALAREAVSCGLALIWTCFLGISLNSTKD